MVAAHKKVTVSLDAGLVEEVQRLVNEGRAPSQSAFFEEALRRKLREIRREERRKALLAASKDPLFLADIEEIEREFASADAEAARMLR